MLSIAAPAPARAARGRNQLGLVAGTVVALGAVGVVGVHGQVRSAYRRYGAVAAPAPVVDLLVPAAAHAGGEPLHLVAFGDSGMAGVGAQAVEDTLPAQLARRLADGTGRPVRVRSHASSGARTADVLARQLPQVVGPVDVSVLMVGTNDVTHLTPSGRLAADTRRLLEALMALGAPVVVSDLPEFRAMTAVPWTVRAAARARARQVDRLQAAAAAGLPGVHQVLVRAAVGDRFRRDPSTVSADRFHPSPAGYALLADALAEAVTAAVLRPGPALREGAA